MQESGRDLILPSAIEDPFQERLCLGIRFIDGRISNSSL